VFLLLFALWFLLNCAMNGNALKLAEAAALIRARHGFRLPDALQIAAAIDGDTTLFITNDARLKKLDTIEVLVLSDYLRH
jgi:predicted nucleic acid-binding protein